MTRGFEDIAIVDLDLVKTTWSRVHSSMRTLYLRLTREPEVGWSRFFHEERESRIGLKRHGLWIEDGYIVFDCLVEDVEEHHLPDFRLSVAYANAKYREFLIERSEQGEQMRDDERVEQLELAALRNRIRRDRGTDATSVAAARAPRTNGAVAAPPPVVPDPSAPRTDDDMDTAPPAPVAALPIPKWAQAIAAAKAAPRKFITADATSTRPAATPTIAKIEELAPPAEMLTGESPAVAATQTDAQGAPDSRITGAEDPPTAAFQTNEAQLPATTSTTTQPSPAVKTPAIAPSPSAATPAIPTHEPADDAIPDIADFNAKREEWRARFRAALASRPKEPARGND